MRTLFVLQNEQLLSIYLGERRFAYRQIDAAHEGLDCCSCLRFDAAAGAGPYTYHGPHHIALPRPHLDSNHNTKSLDVPVV